MAKSSSFNINTDLKNKDIPKVSVVMSVYNEENYLKNAIKSILDQTFRNFEFIIINDASTDQSEKIIDSFKDTRVIRLKNSNNLKLAASLNKAIKASKGKYIVRMDADDISDKQRLQKQVDFMDDNPQVDVCGTWVRVFGSVRDKWKYPTDDDDIKVRLLFNNVLVHPSVIIRKRSFQKYKLIYDPYFSRLQDYDLWVRSSNKLRFANISEYLLRLRMKKKCTKIIKNQPDYYLWEKIIRLQLGEIGLVPTENDLEIHRTLANENFRFVNIINLHYYLFKLIKANCKTKKYKMGILTEVLIKKYLVSIFNGFQNSYAE